MPLKQQRNKEEDKKNGILNREGYISEATSIIEDEEGDEESESEDSQQNSDKDMQEEQKEPEKKSEKEEEKKQTQREPRHAKIIAVENIHNSSIKSDQKVEEEVKEEIHQRFKRKQPGIAKTPEINNVKPMKTLKRNISTSNTSAAKLRDKKMIRKQNEENSETISDNFQQKDQIKINGMIKSANRKKIDSLNKAIAFIRIKLDNVLNEKFKATDLAAEENSVKILGDLSQLDYLYTNKIDEHIRVNTL